MKPAGDTMKNRGAEKMPAAPTEPKAAMTPRATEMPMKSEMPKANARNARGKKVDDVVATPAPSLDRAEPTASAAPAENKKEKMNARDRAKTGATPAATATATPMGTATPAPSASPTPAGTPMRRPDASATPQTSTSVTTGTSAQANATAKRPEPKQLEKIREQHANFRAQPRPDKVPAVTFSANYRLQGSDRWQGPKYEVYRSYRPERHDRSYYQSRYKRVELVGGGYYYMDNGYWYPAWGYDTSNEYYAYDAPIYVGSRALPPDRVIADVQAALQEMGYYRGEVDGLLGPLTREALTGYQSRHGLTVTAVIDEPTLDALGMG
jgi:hypothetical protein